MGFSHREFHVNLRTAFGDGYQVSEDGTVVEIPLHEGRVLIRLGPEGVRRIASLALPCTEVEFRFENLDATRRSAFDTAFRRSFQRGGG